MYPIVCGRWPNAWLTEATNPTHALLSARELTRDALAINLGITFVPAATRNIPVLRPPAVVGLNEGIVIAGR